MPSAVTSAVATVAGQFGVLALEQAGLRFERNGQPEWATKAYRRAALLATDTGEPEEVVEMLLDREELARTRTELGVRDRGVPLARPGSK